MFQPLGSKVAIKRFAIEDKTESGIILPDSRRKKPENRATVVAIGPKVISVAVGDVVLTTDFAGSIINVGGEELIVVREEDIVGVLENE